MSCKAAIRNDMLVCLNSLVSLENLLPSFAVEDPIDHLNLRGEYFRFDELKPDVAEQLPGIRKSFLTTEIRPLDDGIEDVQFRGAQGGRGQDGNQSIDGKEGKMFVLVDLVEPLSDDALESVPDLGQVVVGGDRVVKDDVVCITRVYQVVLADLNYHSKIQLPGARNDRSDGLAVQLDVRCVQEVDDV